MLIPVWLKNTGYIIAAILGVKYDVLLAFGALMIMDVLTGVIGDMVGVHYTAEAEFIT